MQVAQKWGSFFYTYTQCTKFSFGFLFQGNSGNIREIFVFPCPHEGEREGRKDSALSDLLYLTAVRGRSYAEGAQRDSGAIPLRVPACRFSLGLYDELLSSPP